MASGVTNIRRLSGEKMKVNNIGDYTLLKAGSLTVEVRASQTGKHNSKILAVPKANNYVYAAVSWAHSYP